MKKSKVKPTEAEIWLHDDGKKAQRGLLLVAIFQLCAFGSQMLQWLGLALIAELLLHHSKHVFLPAMFLLGGFWLAGVFHWLAGRTHAKAMTAARDYRQTKLLAILLPSQASKATIKPSTGVNAMFERIDEIAKYQTFIRPLNLTAPIEMGVVLLLVFSIHWPSGVILLLSMIVIPMNMMVAGKLTKEGHDAFLQQLNRLSAMITDSFSGLETLLKFDGIGQRRKVIQTASDELTETNIAILKRAFISGMIMDVVVTFSIAVIATYEGMTLLHYLNLPGQPLTLASALFILLLTPMFFTPFRTRAAAFHDKSHAEVAGRELATLKTVKVNLQGVKTSVEQLSLQAVTIGSADKTIVTVPNLSAQVNDNVVITGVSGSGKTTVLKTLVGIMSITSGEAQIAQLKDVAWIGQEVLLVAGTLAENLRLGNQAATQAELITALEIAHLSQWFNGLTDGFETMLGNNAMVLSAGELKRLAIARAYLRNAPIWLLDEPTAHLDRPNAALVVDSIEIARRDKIVIQSTHDELVLAKATKHLQIIGGATYEHQ